MFVDLLNFQQCNPRKASRNNSNVLFITILVFVGSVKHFFFRNVIISRISSTFFKKRHFVSLSSNCFGSKFLAVLLRKCRVGKFCKIKYLKVELSIMLFILGFSHKLLRSLIHNGSHGYFFLST